MSEIEAAVVESTWQDVAQLKPQRIRSEIERAGREQPDLLGFVLDATDGLRPEVNELAGYIYFVLWRAVRRSTKGLLPPIPSAAIQRKLEENENLMRRYEKADPQFLGKAVADEITKQPALFAYMVEAVFEVDEDDTEPLKVTEEEGGTLFLVLKTAIDVLHEAREQAQGGGGS